MRARVCVCVCVCVRREGWLLSLWRSVNFRESPDELWLHCLLQLSALVDGIYAEHGHTAGSFTHLASDRLLVGGGADARSLQGAKGINNFVGCLRKVSEICSFAGSTWSTLPLAIYLAGVASRSGAGNWASYSPLSFGTLGSVKRFLISLHTINIQPWRNERRVIPRVVSLLGDDVNYDQF